jgi:hypothetical protein
MGRILNELSANESSSRELAPVKVEQHMLPQSCEEEAAAVGQNLSGDGLASAAMEFLSTFKKPDVNSFGQNFRYVHCVEDACSILRTIQKSFLLKDVIYIVALFHVHELGIIWF